jgi:spermidine synthase
LISRPLLHILFFLSGGAALLYQVIWVRQFGNLFGNGVWSAALVTAIFMAGLGIGGHVAGRIADRRPDEALRLYGWVELAIGGWGLVVALALPAAGALSSSFSAYAQGPDFFSLTVGSWFGRVAIVTLLLLPSTLLMGATLTLLIQHVLLGKDGGAVEGWRTGALYGANTGGAALGALLADFVLVPNLGARAAQLVAVGINVAVAAVVLMLANRSSAPARPVGPETTAPAGFGWAGLALAISGFAGMGLEVLWFRFFSSALGGYRSVFALLLAVLLVGMWGGSALAGWAAHRTGRPALLQAIAQTALVVTTLVFLALLDVDRAREVLNDPAGFGEHLSNLIPMLKVVALPGLLMGAAYPLLNALVQSAGPEIGRRAGKLYLFNTAGAVAGSLLTGFVLIPAFGVQRTLPLLAGIALLGLIPLLAATRMFAPGELPALKRALPIFALVGVIAVGGWAMRPKDAVLFSAFVPGWSDEIELLAVREGPNEVSVVAKWPGIGLALFTNGHNMSGTTQGSQRYMRAMAHLPLLMLETPRRALVICFGVGNTVHATSLHPLEKIDVAELSPDVLALAPFFKETNGQVLDDPRVSAFVNDGRQHLRMQAEGTYDLITLEPPPIAFAGVGALYSREFYALARSRLAAGGFLTQWLPAYQVSPDVARAMAASFVAEFPDAVLLSGHGAELILLGSKGGDTRLQLSTVRERLGKRPRVAEDLARFELGTDDGLVSLLVASSAELTKYVEGSPLVTDDRPLNEYGARSKKRQFQLDPGLFPANDLAGWCSDCAGHEAALEPMRLRYRSPAFLSGQR